MIFPKTKDKISKIKKKFSFNVSNNSTNRKGIAPNPAPNTEEDFELDIHFDQPIDPEHLEGADTDDFHLHHGEDEDTQEEEPVEDYDFDSLPEAETQENEENIVTEDDYDFDSLPEAETQESEEAIAEDDYDFDSLPEAETGQTLAEELDELDGMDEIKMQSATSFNQQNEENDEVADEDYDFNLEDEPQNEEESDDADYDFNLEEEPQNEEEAADEDYDFNLEEEPEEETPIETPTSSKIAQMIRPKEQPEISHKKPKIDKPIKKNKKTFGNHIDFHKTKIILIAILALISALWGYASQVGITTKSIPTFQNGTIKILKTQGVQMQYTIREKLIFHQSQMQIALNDSTTMEINGTTSLSSKLFSNIQHNLKNATFTISDSTIKITSTNDINILNTLTELINQEFSPMLENITITDTTLTVEDLQGKIIDNISIDHLEIHNTPQKSTITGTILTNSKPITIKYSHTKSNHLLEATIKSPSFNFTINGTQKTFGTASKDFQTKGNIELIISDLEEFTTIFGGKPKITQYLKNLPQLTIQLDFEHSSLNHEFSVSKGKINALNSIGLFTLKTTPNSYQATVNFETISITEVISKIIGETKTPPPITKTKKPEENKKNINKSHALNIFSIINPAKPLEIKIVSKNISSQNEPLFKNLESNLTITKENIDLHTLQLQAGENLQIEASGAINNIQSNPTSILNISISGNGNYKNIVSKIVQFATDFEISKTITDETSTVNLSIVHKAPSTTINTVSIEIQDTLSLQGSTQFTEHFSENTTPSSFRNITISNTDLNNLKIDGISTPQGMTIFQSVINENAQNTGKVLNIINSKFKDTTITQGTITKDTQKDTITYSVDINTTDFTLTNSTIINIQQNIPTIHSKTIVQNVESMQKFYNIIRNIFDKNTISYPSFEKIDGNIDFTLIKSQILGKPFEKIELLGILKQGVLTIPETQFSSIVTNAEKPLSGKLSGTIDLRRSIPVFNLQTTIINAPIEEFKTILPFQTDIGGAIYGGGSVSFSGTTYTEFLNTLKLTTKFVVQEAYFSKLNLDFISQHLLKAHKNLSALDTDYLKIAFEQDTKTKANFIFSLNGNDKTFAIEDCTIKTAYSAGVCYGNLTIGEQNKSTIEIIAKFAIPALDINKGLKEVMKLYISSKIKKTDEACEITNDLSQINKYTSYRRTTFSS